MCDRCQQCSNQGDNYCRKCGRHLTAGTHQKSKVSHTYFTDEKYCGYCGKNKNKCGH